MKLNTKRIWVFVMPFLLVAVISCKKNQNIENNNSLKIIFDLKGVVKDEAPKEIMASRSIASSQSNEQLLQRRKFDFNGLEAEMSIYQMNDRSIVLKDEQTSSVKATAPRKANNNAPLTASSPLEVGTKYRVLVYDENDVYIGSIDGSSGTLADAVDVSYNKTYKWFAYSFGSSAPLPALNSQTDPSITATPTLGLLYASGEVSPTQAGENKVEIIFERRLSWVELTIDTRGTFAPMIPNGTEVTTSNLTSSIFKIKSNSYINPQSVEGVLQGNDFSKQNATVTKDSVFIGSFYLADDGRNSPFTINLKSIQLKLDYLDPIGKNVVRTFNNIPYSFNFVPESGKRYSIKIKLIESGVEVSGIKWARGNLHYTWSDNGFRFRHSSIHPYQSSLYPWIFTNIPNDYYYNGMYPPWTGNDNYSDFNNRPVEFWNFKTVVPYAGDQLYDVIKIYNDLNNRPEYTNPYTGKGYYYENIPSYGPTYYASIPNGDPCKLVYPEGKWRLPNKAEASSLITWLQNNAGKTIVTDNTNNYYVGRFPYTTSTADVYGNVLEFPFRGAITTAAGWSSGGMGPGYPSDMLGSTGDPRFGYEMTNSFYWYNESPSDYNKSSYMMYWTSDNASVNTRSGSNYPYAWAFSMKAQDGQFVTPTSGAYPNLIGGYPASSVGGTPAPQIREAYSGDGLNIRCVRSN